MHIIEELEIWKYLMDVHGKDMLLQNGMIAGKRRCVSKAVPHPELCRMRQGMH